MGNQISVFRNMSISCFIIILWIVLFLWLGRKQNNIDFWAIMLIGSAIITFYSFLSLPGSIDEAGAFRESRIRLAITATLIITYLVFFGSMVYLDSVKTMADDLVPTLTNLLMVTVSFYFGSTAAVEIAKTMNKNKNADSKEIT